MQYNAVKKLSNLINSWFRNVIFGFMISVIFEYSVDLDSFWTGKADLESVTWMLVWFSFLRKASGALFLPADACDKVLLISTKPRNIFNA